MAWRASKKNFVGFRANKGENLSSSASQPPPQNYPKLSFTPLPLRTEPEYDYILKLKQDHRQYFKDSQYYLKIETSRKDIDRYTDKYSSSNASDWQPDFSQLPKELHTKCIKGKRKNANRHSKVDVVDILQKLESNEEVIGDEEDDESPSKKTKPDDDDDDDEEEEEEGEEDEDAEEENDYVENYFDNGEDYGDESNGSNDEATF
ncbi:hypothetical protein HELRODRAFT_171655 [Helobdella robusta]|uniref:DNA-directed RNA polymerase III subunit n=1 Tax=Helobdella robusta TaxID=6412 RepID=T1F4I8_HELRO|nr:hypothetical protein HELRODRAFT_171655 [Helobdella robusta]ESO05292.1 hypothetical protein HELRODRAFT_171655 [Helobdella robusta]